jgi:hypothetical protein
MDEVSVSRLGSAAPFSIGWWAVVQDDFEHDGPSYLIASSGRVRLPVYGNADLPPRNGDVTALVESPTGHQAS